ncbi:hypothetical protein HC762_01630, partial [bacterium]|nr:hypothetical protein [bacterium]
SIVKEDLDENSGRKEGEKREKRMKREIGSREDGKARGRVILTVLSNVLVGFSSSPFVAQHIHALSYQRPP